MSVAAEMLRDRCLALVAEHDRAAADAIAAKRDVEAAVDRQRAAAVRLHVVRMELRDVCGSEWK